LSLEYHFQQLEEAWEVVKTLVDVGANVSALSQDSPRKEDLHRQLQLVEPAGFCLSGLIMHLPHSTLRAPLPEIIRALPHLERKGWQRYNHTQKCSWPQPLEAAIRSSWREDAQVIASTLSTAKLNTETATERIFLRRCCDQVVPTLEFYWSRIRILEHALEAEEWDLTVYLLQSRGATLGSKRIQTIELFEQHRNDLGSWSPAQLPLRWLGRCPDCIRVILC